MKLVGIASSIVPSLSSISVTLGTPVMNPRKMICLFRTFSIGGRWSLLMLRSSGHWVLQITCSLYGTQSNRFLQGSWLCGHGHGRPRNRAMWARLGNEWPPIDSRQDLQQCAEKCQYTSEVEPIGICQVTGLRRAHPCCQLPIWPPFPCL